MQAVAPTELRGMDAVESSRCVQKGYWSVRTDPEIEMIILGSEAGYLRLERAGFLKPFSAHDCGRRMNEVTAEHLVKHLEYIKRAVGQTRGPITHQFGKRTRRGMIRFQIHHLVSGVVVPQMALGEHRRRVMGCP